MSDKVFKANQIVDVRWKSGGAEESDDTDESTGIFVGGEIAR